MNDSFLAEQFIEVGIKSALLVGINEFEDPNITRLKYCVNDINGIYEILIDEKKGKYESEKITRLTDNSTPATRNRVISRITDLARRANPEDSILFAFSGHGIEKERIPYLLCSDSFTNSLEVTGIPLHDIRTILEKSLARIKIIIIDACHSGVIKDRKDAGLMGETFYNLFFPPPEGFIILTSCQVNEFSYEWDEKENGVFSYYLMEGLDGAADIDGNQIITTQEVFDYAKGKVVRWAFDKGYKQTPVYDKTLIRDVPFTYTESQKIIPETYDYSMIYYVLYISKYYKTENEVISKLRQFLGELLAFYDYNKITKTDEIYRFPDGEIQYRANEEGSWIYLYIYVRNDNERICNDVFSIINKDFEWDYVKYQLNKPLDFNKLYEKGKKQLFKILSFEPGTDKKEIEFETEGWSSTRSTFEISDEKTILQITAKTGRLSGNFHEVLNPRNISDFINDLF